MIPLGLTFLLIAVGCVLTAYATSRSHNRSETVSERVEADWQWPERTE